MLAWLMVCVVQQLGCANPEPLEPPAASPAELDQRWSATVAPWLTQDLWTDAERYGAGQGLMVPLHAAFYGGRRTWQRAFADQFRRLVDANPTIDPTPGTELSWLQYLYLASRFLVLSARTGKLDLVPQRLPLLLSQTTHDVWTVLPAWQWDRDPFPGGSRERLAWKLAAGWTAKSYYRAIVDQELFLFAIAADLREYERLTKVPDLYSDDLTAILATARDVCQQRMVWRADGGWLFQPGVWSDHPDDQFAGHLVKTTDLQPLPRAMVADDASHSHRMARWLTSLRDAAGPGSPDYGYYQRLIQGLDRQFFKHVLLSPTGEFPGYRTTNFMDGWNGVYGSEVTRGRTYGPFELSGTITLGWWAFLESPRSRALYRQLAGSFPLPPEVVRLYSGPDTIGPPHPVLGKPLGFENGYRRLVVDLAAEL